jgi:AMP phosphorylase
MPYIKKMMNKEPMTEAEIRAIVQDVVDDKLSDIEITAYVTAGYMRTPNMQETAWLTKAMIDTGDTIHFANHPVADKHSIGGVPGNKVTLLVVPIVAAAGLPIPKTCSRAITGAGGTADLMEIIASVEFKADEVKELTEKNGAVIVWGGATNIAPSDDKLIRPEYELTIDPYSQMLASIMAKKGAVGADIVVMDMPVGPGTKLPTMEHAKRCAKDIIELGKMLGMRVECAATFGGAPMGRTVGPGLEVVEALRMLEGKGGPTSLREKSLELAGILLEMGGKADKGSGYSVAEQLLVSGKAHEKFLDIVEIQGGDRKVTSESIPMGDHVVRVYSPRHGFVQSFRNKRIVEVARLAGAPDDKGAGVFLHKKMGESIKKGEPIFTIYSSTESGADAALASMNADLPVTIDGMLMERMAE